MVCHGEVIDERSHGEDTSDKVDVDIPNSVVGRLTMLLNHLHSEYPGQGLDQFVSGTKVDWSKIAVVGHSQGGKTAAYLSKDFSMARAVLLSGTGSSTRDSDGNPELAPWTLESRKTPASRTYGLWHAGEASNAYAPIILESYGLIDFGETHDVDDGDAPFECSHMLRTKTVPGRNNTGTGCNEHNSTVADDCMELDANGVPVITPAHLHMMTFEETR